MEFRYFCTQVFSDSLEIDSIGNCAIEANDNLGQFQYLIIKTFLGNTKVMQCGPIIVDMEMLPKKTQCTIDSFDYNETKIESFIDGFLNKSKIKVTQARVLEADEALDKCKDLIAYMRNYGEY